MTTVAPSVPEKAIPEKAAPSGAAPASGAGETALGANYVISAKDVLPAFSSKTVTACRAFDRRMPSEVFIAQVCSGDVMPRLEAMAALRGFGRVGMLTLKDFGPIDWADGRQRLAIIYSAPSGAKLSLSPHKAWQVIDELLKPIATALVEIHSHGAVHRAIRPDNLFLRDPGVSTLTLGPCVANPPGFEQPDIYEPLDAAMADPSGRPAGGPKYDMFALGMTAVAMLLGKQPGSEYDRDELMIRRIELGSLEAVAPFHTLPREIVDALHGLTADDESERWTLADLQKWLSAGRPDPPRLPDALPRNIPPYSIGGKQVRSTRSLAYMLGRNWQEGVRQLSGDDLHRWVHDHAPERMAPALLDRAMVDREPDADAADSDALTVTRAVMALDAEGPIRYRGLAVDPHGLGPFLFDAMATPEKRTGASGILRYTLAQKLLERRVSGRRPDRRRATRQAINYERLRRWVLSPQPWEGYERCLYDLNINLPCLSPMAGGRWVGSVAELIKALDDAASSGRVTEPVIDNHVAAFIGARFDASGDALLTLMQPKDADDDATLGAIRLFAELQQTYGGAPLPGIATWCAKLARRVAEGFHHRPTRQLMLEAIDRAQQAGGIAPILKAVDSPGVKSRDGRAYALAKSAWMRLQLEATVIERNKEIRRERAWRRGRDNAAFAAGAGSLVAMFITLFLDSAK